MTTQLRRPPSYEDHPTKKNFKNSLNTWKTCIQQPAELRRPPSYDDSPTAKNFKFVYDYHSMMTVQLRWPPGYDNHPVTTTTLLKKNFKSLSNTWKTCLRQPVKLRRQNQLRHIQSTPLCQKLTIKPIPGQHPKTLPSIGCVLLTIRMTYRICTV